MLKIIENNYHTKHGNIAYLKTGIGKKTFIWFHGGLGNPAWIKLIGPYFSKRGYQVITPYLPGHGGSFKITKDFTYPKLLKSISEFVESFDIENSIWGGHSFGGRIVYDLALAKTVNIQAAILSSPLLNLTQTNMIRAYINVANDLFIDQKLKREEFDWNTSTKIKSAHYRTAIRFWKLVVSTGIIKDCINNIPVLFLWGQNDSSLPLSKSLKLIQNIKHAKLVTFPGRHYYYNRSPRKFLKTIDDFVSTNSSV